MMLSTSQDDRNDSSAYMCVCVCVALRSGRSLARGTCHASSGPRTPRPYVCYPLWCFARKQRDRPQHVRCPQGVPLAIGRSAIAYRQFCRSCSPQRRLQPPCPPRMKSRRRPVRSRAPQRFGLSCARRASGSVTTPTHCANGCGGRQWGQLLGHSGPYDPLGLQFSMCGLGGGGGGHWISVSHRND